ncbi:MAG TPA: hypothetical protein VNE19_05855 [Methylomirabilota bacterium]|jgi:hypothetical protein|nr:hypothetical protein [Methylomirabilota bacterium]
MRSTLIRFVATVMLVLPVLLAVMPAAPAAAAAGKIQGTITNKLTGQPVADACVTLGPPVLCFGAFGANPGLHTNAAGYYLVDLDALSAIDGGTWELYFLKDGYTMLYSGRFTSNGGWTFNGQMSPTGMATPPPPPAPCGSIGPGIAAPAVVPASIPGRHAAWYGQSGYPTLCAGQRSTATVAFYNSGSIGWVRGRMGEVAYLGTWGPEPGQDSTTALGGDGQRGTPNTGWPRYNRIAMQPADYVGPGQVAWFQFTIVAPASPGTYKLYLRPLIEGAAWLEDFGVFWVVTVR